MECWPFAPPDHVAVALAGAMVLCSNRRYSGTFAAAAAQGERHVLSINDASDCPCRICFDACRLVADIGALRLPIYLQCDSCPRRMRQRKQHATRFRDL